MIITSLDNDNVKKWKKLCKKKYRDEFGMFKNREELLKKKILMVF